ncbi:hypothetical protein [Moritella yayanosii]|uniref:Putative lipoprotein n=1 Tax=Moritella yayanosii TaxID=69539 RepID=A0A330LVW4_9GAMM|nr:hypothetical protein [Moritella yayanosii]SQD79938.1 putative lipoprotein [Moritella yayanosii]
MSRLLALSILVSTALTGCGGGDDGGSGSSGGGSTPTPATKYTFEFVKLSEGSQSGCTVFDGLEQNFDTKYYANNVQPQRLEIHDASGHKVDVSLKPLNGAITFTADVVPEGGYVSIIDYSSGSRTYQVLSIQKELLGDYLIRLNGDSFGTCYNKNKGLDKKSGTAFISVLPGGDSSYYQFDTSLETKNKISNAFTADINAYADEKVLAKGYNGNTTDLIVYGFTELDAEATELSVIDDNLNWSATNFTSTELDSLAISVKQGNYIYPWYDAQSKVAFPHYSDAISEWFYTATGKQRNWNFKHNAKFTYEFDVSLMVNIDSNVDASISKPGTSYVFSASGISSSHDLVQRSYYYTQNISTPITTLTHVMYGIPNNAGEVIIPDLKLDRLLPTDTPTITVSMAATKSLDADFVESFMRRFQPIDPNTASFLTEDSISLLLTPADQLKQRQNTKMHDYTIVER